MLQQSDLRQNLLYKNLRNQHLQFRLKNLSLISLFSLLINVEMSAANKVVVVLGATGIVGQGVTHKFLTEGKTIFETD